MADSKEAALIDDGGRDVYEHLIEFGLITAPTAGLGYVTAFPYHVRRRHADTLRQHCVTIYGVCRYHGRWILWQVSVLLPRRRVRHRGEDD